MERAAAASLAQAERQGRLSRQSSSGSASGGGFGEKLLGRLSLGGSGGGGGGGGGDRGGGTQALPSPQTRIPASLQFTAEGHQGTIGGCYGLTFDRLAASEIWPSKTGGFCWVKLIPWTAKFAELKL